MIKGNLVTLKLYSREDCHELYKNYISDAQMTNHEYRYDFRKTDSFYSIKTAEANRAVYGIYRNHEIIGEIQLKNINFKESHGVLSIILRDDSVKGKGYGTEAERLLIDYAFNHLKLNKIFADTTSGNKRSQYILLKLGFKHLKDENEMSYFEMVK